MKIITNNQTRNFLYESDLTDKQKREFDYNIEDSSFIKYKGEVYDLNDFYRCHNTPNWDAAYNHTVFSGILIKLTGDGYKIARYYN